MVGPLNQSNTGKEIYFSATTSFTLNDGKLVDEKREEGALTALHQLGLGRNPVQGRRLDMMLMVIKSETYFLSLNPKESPMMLR